MKRWTFFGLLTIALATQTVVADELSEQLNVKYGEHKRQVLDFYPRQIRQADTRCFLHSRGWMARRR